MRRTVYIQDELWNRLAAKAEQVGLWESGKPLSISAYLCRLIHNDCSPRAATGTALSAADAIRRANYLPSVESREALEFGPVDTTPGGWERQPVDTSIAPRQPRVQGPITKADSTRRKGK